MAFETIFKRFTCEKGEKEGLTLAIDKDGYILMTVDKSLSLEGKDRTEDLITLKNNYDDDGFGYAVMSSFQIEKNQFKSIIEMGKRKMKKERVRKHESKIRHDQISSWIISERGHNVEFVPLLSEVTGSPKLADFNILTDIKSETKFDVQVYHYYLYNVLNSIARYNEKQGEVHKYVNVDILGVYGRDDILKLEYVERDHIVTIYLKCLPYVAKHLLTQVIRTRQDAPEAHNRLEAEIVSGWGVGIFRACVGGSA